MDHTRTIDDVDDGHSQYTSRRRSERSRRSRREGRQSSRKLRILYFCAASLWGFVAGALGVAVALNGLSTFASPGAQFFLMSAAAGLALFGGALMASAYREARKRQLSSAEDRT